MEALAYAQLTSLKERRAQLYEHFFTQNEQPQHTLYKLFPKANVLTHNTRYRIRYPLPRVNQQAHGPRTVSLTGVCSIKRTHSDSSNKLRTR